MVQRLAVITLLLAPSGVEAQEQTACSAFQAQSGTAIVFKDEAANRQYGFQRFHETPSNMGAMPYESLVGHKGKVVGSKSGAYGIEHYHEVLLDDCRTVFWYDTDAQLEPDDALFAGVEFIDKPPTMWSVSESTDRMTDAKSCMVTPQSRMPYPMFFYHSKEGFSVGVVGGDFPGRPTTFRVDRNKAIAETEGLSGSRAQLLVKQIRAGGKELLVGAYEWPNDYEVQKEFNLAGLVEQLDRCKSSVGD